MLQDPSTPDHRLDGGGGGRGPTGHRGSVHLVPEKVKFGHFPFPFLLYENVKSKKEIENNYQVNQEIKHLFHDTHDLVHTLKSLNRANHSNTQKIY